MLFIPYKSVTLRDVINLVTSLDLLFVATRPVIKRAEERQGRIPLFITTHPDRQVDVRFRANGETPQSSRPMQTSRLYTVAGRHGHGWLPKGSQIPLSSPVQSGPVPQAGLLIPRPNFAHALLDCKWTVGTSRRGNKPVLHFFAAVGEKNLLVRYVSY